MEQLGWLQIGQHQLQQDVTHGLAFVLVDGRDNKLDFADLIDVFLLDGYGIFHVGLLPERYETMTDSPPCPVGKRKRAAPTKVSPLSFATLVSSFFWKVICQGCFLHDISPYIKKPNKHAKISLNITSFANIIIEKPTNFCYTYFYN